MLRQINVTSLSLAEARQGEKTQFPLLRLIFLLNYIFLTRFSTDKGFMLLLITEMEENRKLVMLSAVIIGYSVKQLSRCLHSFSSAGLLPVRAVTSCDEPRQAVTATED